MALPGVDCGRDTESDENFFLNLSGEESASVADGEGEANIEDSVPAVLRLRPTEGSTTSVRPAANVVVTFSKEMDPNSVNLNTFYLKKDGSSEIVPAAVSYDATYRRAILNPDSKLTPGASYTATVKGGVEGVKDLLGRELASERTWSFTLTPDESAPSVVKVSPSQGATTISPQANVAAVFSEAMDPTTITKAIFKLYKKRARGLPLGPR